MEKLGEGFSQQRGRDEGDKTENLPTVYLFQHHRTDGRRRGFGLSGDKGAQEGSAVVKLKAAENLLEQADDERGEGGKRLQPPMVAQRLVRMVG